MRKNFFCGCTPECQIRLLSWFELDMTDSQNGSQFTYSKENPPFKSNESNEALHKNTDATAHTILKVKSSLIRSPLSACLSLFLFLLPSKSVTRLSLTFACTHLDRHVRQIFLNSAIHKSINIFWLIFNHSLHLGWTFLPAIRLPPLILWPLALLNTVISLCVGACNKAVAIKAKINKRTDLDWLHWVTQTATRNK